MREISLEELLEAGCHFGHQVTRHNPKSRDFVFEARDNIHIIDLAKTKEGLEEAAAFIKDMASKGNSILVVGTKRQARSIVEENVKRAISETTTDGSEQAIFYITTRWIGGILTNFTEIGKNIKKLKEITERLQNPEERAKYTKKEVGLWEKEASKLRNFYGGILEMKKSPDALFIIDTHNEDLAVREASRTNVKTVGITDTNSDPGAVDYAIPANDDAVGSIKLITDYIIDAWIEGRKQVGKEKVEEKKTEKDGFDKLTIKKPAKKPASKKKEEKSDKDIAKEVKTKVKIKKEKK
ncbi:MAG: 30S ribosomal protein S2 [Patescibacteria group bacterium]|nr:30S ribosomal protein S2 [Patescibacteria group bacterium]